MSVVDNTVTFCPSFSSYASENTINVANKVAEQMATEEEFEFVSIRSESDSSPIFFDGQIREVFPVFNRDLIEKENEIHLPLKKLFLEEDRERESESESEVDELEGVPEESYCVWTPRRNSTSSPSICKKSNSTGSSTAATSTSKRWMKFRELLKRSNSEGNEPYVFLNKTKTSTSTGTDPKIRSPNRGKTGKKVSAHEAFYVKNRAIKQGDKKRSYLPYRPDLFGFFANVNGFGRTSLPPF